MIYSHSIVIPPLISLLVIIVMILSSSSTTHAHALSSDSNIRKAVLVTGSTDGIGVTTAKNMAKMGYDVLIHGRDKQRIDCAKQIVEKFIQSSSSSSNNSVGRVFTLPPADLSTIDGSRKLVRDVQTLCQNDDSINLTVLMNNAGVFAEKHVITSDGLELTFAVNVVAPFVITSLLLPILLQQPKSRIVIASSISQSSSIRDWDDLNYKKRGTFSSHSSYSQSKLLDAMLSMEFAHRLKEKFSNTNTITCNCLDPGTVNTKMLLAGWGPCGIDVKDALDQTWLCTSDDVDGITGRYYVYQSDRNASSSAYDQQQRSKLWLILSNLVPDAAEIWNFHWLEDDK